MSGGMLGFCGVFGAGVQYAFRLWLVLIIFGKCAVLFNGCLWWNGILYMIDCLYSVCVKINDLVAMWAYGWMVWVVVLVQNLCVYVVTRVYYQ